MITTVLFDFDGVISDTEPLYDQYWNDAALRYHLGIPNFATKIKGTIMPDILATYFANHTEEQRAQIQAECDKFEEELVYPEIPGALVFLQRLKDKHFKLGLVTSSTSRKIENAIKILHLENTFDVIITADHITAGKPSPQCYLLAAQKLQADPSQCIVFEDSLAGIHAGKAAGMKVIGLSTTNSIETLKREVAIVIPDFTAISDHDLTQWTV